MTSKPWAGTARAAPAAASAAGRGVRSGRTPSPRHAAGRSRVTSFAPGLPLIVHADDFGETPEITRGICLAIEAGAVTSTSIMANMPGTAEALQRVAGLSGRASFGVHLNLCEGKPLTLGGSLVDAAGGFHSKRTLFIKSVTRGLVLRDVEREIAAQIGRVRDHGVRISHLDGHKHLHQLPIVSTAVANVLPRFAIRRVRITRLGSLSCTRGAALLVRELLAMKASGKFRQVGLRSPVRTLDLRPLMSEGGLERGSCVDPRGPVELCCHPGTGAADAQKPGSHVRGAELEFLLSARFRELLGANGARLVSYWDV